MLITRNILNLMARTNPTPQNAVDIFPGGWTSSLPDIDGNKLRAGSANLFDDPRIRWAGEFFNGFDDQNILELGPLEGGHSYMLSKMGAKRVLGVEANSRLFLKCLITKELYQLERCQFILGDFLSFMKQTPERFDFCLASGVLYHMANPVELLALIARVSNRALLWTQYYDHSIIRSRMSYMKRSRFRPGLMTTYEGFTYTSYRRRYGLGLRNLMFIGGTESYSCWMSLEDILAGLRHFGFTRTEVNFHDREHANGPAVCIACSK